MTMESEEPRILMIVRQSSAARALEDALGELGAQVVRVDFPEPRPVAGSGPLAGLAGLAASVGAALREAIEGVDITELMRGLAAIEGRPGGVVFLDGDIARRLSAEVSARWPGVASVGVATDLSVGPAWIETGLRVISAREDGGPLVGLGEEHRRLPDGADHLVVAFDPQEAQWVDPLLLQLSLTRLDDTELVFLPSEDPGIDDMVKTRASFYGLRGHRPTGTLELDAWVRGARAVVGRPSPSQLISAVSAGVPVVLVGEFSSDSGAAWCIRTRCATEARTAVQVSEAVESACVAGRGEGKDLGTPRRAAQAALAHFASEPGVGAAAQEVELGSGLEPIGGPRERTPPRQPERHVEIEDALSRLKERMRDDDEG